MQKTSQRQKRILGLLVSLLLAAACAVSSFCLADRSVSAETTYNYWHFTEGSGTYAVSLNSQVEGSTSGYIGVETRVTRADSTVKNMGVMLNGAVSPLYSSGTTGKTIIYYDNGDMFAPTADAVVVTFTAMSDMTKQVSIIGTVRNERTFYTVALTDDITVQDGYALVNGKKTIGTESLANVDGSSSITGYSDAGYPMNVHRGAPYGGDAEYHIGRDGIVYVSNWNKLADITDETFLTMSKANLAGSKYEERYTTAYVSEILSSFETGCTMTITWYGLQVNTVDFHIRAYTGYNRKASPVQNYQWIDGGNVELSQYYLAPIVYQRTNEVYKHKTYNVQDLVGAYSFYPDTESFDVYLDHDISTDSGTKVSYAENPTVSFTEDEYFCVGGQNGKNHWSPWGTYLFKVVDSTPVVTARDGVIAVKGVNYNLEKFFDTRVVSDTAVTEITVDGVPVTEAYVFADEAEHVIVCKVTDEYSQSAQGSLTVSAIDLGVRERVDIQAEERERTYFAALPVPQGSTYTLALYDAAADVETDEPYTTQRFYVFERSGEYKLVYTAYLQGAEEPVSFTTVYGVTVVKKAPTITLSGTYGESYFVGETITIISATANNGYEDFTVAFELFNGDTSVKTGFGDYKFTAAGDYSAKYSVQMDDGRKIEETFSFSVEKDEEKPVIIVNGKYAAEYTEGDTIDILQAAAIDNTGDIAYTVSVFFNGEKIEAADNRVVLSVGTYKIVYSAADASGNAADDVTFEFTVKEKESENNDEKSGCGCGGCNSSVDGGAILLAGAIAVFALFIFRRKSKNEDK